ncbi:UNVERIFIED_CONTAM: hypothetical protein HDU68_005246, partial [Siphonaria sp. JEL0065]
MVRLFVSNSNNTVTIDTTFDSQRKKRDADLEIVGDVIAACAMEPTQGLLGLPPNTPFSLHLPLGVTRSDSALDDDCFLTVDESDTTLDPGCLLTSLGFFGVNSKKPLIIEAKTSELGRNTLLWVKGQNLFFKHAHQHGRDPALTEEELQQIQEFKEEKLFDVKMTQIFSALLGPDLTVANSESLGWLAQGESTKTDLRPDFNVSLKGLYCRKPEPTTTTKTEHIENARELARSKGFVFHFGIPRRELYDMVTILESKLEFSDNESFGQVVQYLQHLPEGSSAVLFDKKRFWLIRTREKHVVSLIEEVNWGSGGSKIKFVDFVRTPSMNVWGDLILAACRHYGVELVESDAFLGAGATGRVFKVHRATDPLKYYALKVVLPANIRSLCTEWEVLDGVALLSTASEPASSVSSLSSTSSSPSLAALAKRSVVSVEGQFHEFENGAALLLYPVGTPVNRQSFNLDSLRKIAKAIFALHAAGVRHGDARIENLIQVVDPEFNELVWLDFMTSIPHSEFSWSFDASTLSYSILNMGCGTELPTWIIELMGEYVSKKDEASCLALAAGWWDVLK